MVNGQKPASKHLSTIINKVAKDKIYGSVEVYFEAGQITQITQRIINKVSDVSKAPNKVYGSPAHSSTRSQSNPDA